MKLSDEWLTALTESDEGLMIFINSRDDIEEFKKSGKFKERIEVTWNYAGDGQGLPVDELSVRLEEVQNALRTAMEKDKLAILTGIYTGDNQRIWVFYTRNVPAFGEKLNQALASFEELPLSIYTELDPDWGEYEGIYELVKKQDEY